MKGLTVGHSYENVEEVQTDNDSINNLNHDIIRRKNRLCFQTTGSSLKQKDEADKMRLLLRHGGKWHLRRSNEE